MQDKQSGWIVGEEIADVEIVVIARLGLAPGRREQLDLVALLAEDAAHVQNISANRVSRQNRRANDGDAWHVTSEEHPALSGERLQGVQEIAFQTLIGKQR